MVLNLLHLDFEIVSDFDIRISNLQSTHSTKDYVRNYQLFLQNKPKVKYAQINVTPFITSKYVKMDTWLSGKNKPKTKPKQTQTKPNSRTPKMSLNPYPTTAYIKKTANRRNQNKPKQSQFQTQFFQLIYIPFKCRIK
jgi:hypothetical protein